MLKSGGNPEELSINWVRHGVLSLRVLEIVKLVSTILNVAEDEISWRLAGL